MKSRNWGRIINMGSIHSSRVVRDRIDYMTTKHAIIGLTRAVALEAAETGVTCNAVCPGWVLTPHAEGQNRARDGGDRSNARASDLRTGRATPT